jgi:hypothetical protein
LINDILIALDKVLNEKKTPETVRYSVVHDKKQKHLPGGSYEYHLKGNMRGKIGKETGVIAGVIVYSVFTGEIGIGNSDLFQDIFTGGAGVFPAVTKPVLVGGVGIA